MSLWEQTKDSKTKTREEFVLSCDCAGNGESCPQLRFSYRPNSDYVDLVYTPDPYPIRRLWDRIRWAWAVLVRGNVTFTDVCLYRETIQSWGNRLVDLANRMPNETQNNG